MIQILARYHLLTHPNHNQWLSQRRRYLQLPLLENLNELLDQHQRRRRQQ
jgi:hypothetical protein